MKYKQRLPLILLASLITAIFTHAFITWMGTSMASFTTIYGYHLGMLLSFLMAMLVRMSAGLPILLAKKIREVPNMLSITLFATTEAYWLSYFFTGMTVLGWWAWLLVQIVLIVAMYFAADTLFNKWQTRFRYKVITAIGVIMFTAVLGDRALTLLMT